jgi:hypothetical protein
MKLAKLRTVCHHSRRKKEEPLDSHTFYRRRSLRMRRLAAAFWNCDYVAESASVNATGTMKLLGISQLVWLRLFTMTETAGGVGSIRLHIDGEKLVRAFDK